MSYARVGEDSSVYVFGTLVSGGEKIECCGCILQEDVGYVQVEGPAAMLAHLDEHLKAGHKVPDYTLARLREEARQ